MNKLVAQLYVTPNKEDYYAKARKYPKLVDASIDSAVKYAEKCGAEYILLGGEQIMFPERSVCFEIFRFMDESYDRYDDVLLLDVDVIVSEDAPNIFDIQPYAFKSCQWHHGAYDKLGNLSFNPGVYVLPKEFRQQLRELISEDYIKEAGEFLHEAGDAEVFNYFIFKHYKGPKHILEDRWNLSASREETGAYMTHYVGLTKDMYNGT